TAAPQFAVGAFLVAMVLAKKIEHVLANVLAEQIFPVHAAGAQQGGEQRQADAAGGGQADVQFELADDIQVRQRVVPAIEMHRGGGVNRQQLLQRGGVVATGFKQDMR